MESNLRAGDVLKQARLKQHLPISDCAHRTHIALRYLEALEDNRWADLPSESHRQGFINLYARFLGLSAVDVLQRYKVEKEPRNTEVASPENQSASSETQHASANKKSLYSPTVTQLIGILILILLGTWGSYHLLKRGLSESQPAGWVHSRTITMEPRLQPTHPVSHAQKVRIHADDTCWLRVMTDKKLLFEGLLSANTEKEWTGLGPFHIKIAKTHALHVYWNDQPVDINTGAHNGVKTIQLPLTR
jgi:cytoskeleton protein RodZ